MTALAWGAKVSPEFRARVFQICAGFGWGNQHASWLMACMAFETGRTFSPSIRNAAGSGATGLIQFMPRTAIGLGTTTDALSAMTDVAQLDYVQAYFKPYSRRIKTLADMYMAILLPSAIDKNGSAALFSSGRAYAQNAGLDTSLDGTVTKDEATQRVLIHLDMGLRPENVFNEPDQKEAPMSLAGSILVQALPGLINALPEIGSIFKKPDVAERNVEAVAKVGQILMQTTGATNMQEAVERVQADPQTASEANEALRMNRADIVDLMERINAMEQGNIRAAREYNSSEPLFIDAPWVKMKFIHLLSLAFVGFSGVFVSLNWAGLTPELKGAVITLMIIAGWNGVRDYWMGSSSGSDKKTELINQR